MVLALVAPAAPVVGVRRTGRRRPGTRATSSCDAATTPSAQQVYAEHGRRSSDRRVAPRALLLQARAALADGDTDTAEAVLQQLLNDYPSSDQTAAAYFTPGAGAPRRGRLRRRACARWTPSKSSPVARAIGPYAALQRAQCAGKLGDWQGELNAAARGAVDRRRRAAPDAHRSARARCRGRAEDGSQAGRARLLQPLARTGRHAGLQGRDAVHAPPRSPARWARTRWPPSASAPSWSTTPTRRARPARSTR